MLPHYGSRLDISWRRVTQGGRIVLDDAWFLGSFDPIERVKLVGLCLCDTEQKIQNMRDAMDQSHFDDIRGCAHAIKGGAVYMGASVLMDVARHVEDIARTEYPMRARHLNIVLSCLEIALGDVQRAYKAIS